MKVGKNFSCNNSSGKRHASDFYQTPYSITDLLLEREALVGTVLEPACGELAIVSRLPKCDAFYDVEVDFFSRNWNLRNGYNKPSVLVGV